MNGEQPTHRDFLDLIRRQLGLEAWLSGYKQAALAQDWSSPPSQRVSPAPSSRLLGHCTHIHNPHKTHTYICRKIKSKEKQKRGHLDFKKQTYFTNISNQKKGLGQNSGPFKAPIQWLHLQFLASVSSIALWLWVWLSRGPGINRIF